MTVSQGFPLTKPMAVNTGLAECAACDAEMNRLRWTTQSESEQYASVVAVSQHVFMQVADTSNTAFD